MNTEIKHTPTPWVLYSLGDTYKICTPDAEAYVNRNHYLAGAPFVAELNSDFSTDEQHKNKHHYDAVRNPALVKANADFIVTACNAHSSLIAGLKDILASYDANDSRGIAEAIEAARKLTQP